MLCTENWDDSVNVRRNVKLQKEERYQKIKARARVCGVKTCESAKPVKLVKLEKHTKIAKKKG